MPAGPSGLPYVDTHTRTVAVGPDALWSALCSFVDGLGLPPGGLVAQALGTSPPSGFEVVAATPRSEIVLEGRHRFSRYRLVLEVEPRTEQRTTLLHAHTYAEFPGPAGRAYRALVISSGLHVIATNRLLRSIAGRCSTEGSPPVS